MNDILRDIGTIARSLDAIANIEFKEINLSKGQYLYLVRIYENEGIIPERLAELIKVDRTTLSRAIKKLEMNGLITRKTDANNKKIRHLFSTEAGKKAAQFILRENNHSTEVALKNFEATDIEHLSRLLDKMKQNIEDDYNDVKNGIKRLY